MFRHQGKSRTLKHNVRLASVLSLVAGIVNVTGFLAIQKLTTNVTGHFALVIYDMSMLNFWAGAVYVLYIVSFLAGSFVSGFLIELVGRNRSMNKYILPALMEIFLLFSVALASEMGLLHSVDAVACLLLFAMGVQNSFVTKISNAVVRTTHLTGLFTDLGIELSQLLVEQQAGLRKKLMSTVRLRGFIIAFFFLGGIVGGVVYPFARLNTLFVAGSILIGGLVYDDFRYRLITAKRRYFHYKKLTPGVAL